MGHDFSYFVEKYPVEFTEVSEEQSDSEPLIQHLRTRNKQYVIASLSCCKALYLEALTSSIMSVNY